MLSPRRVLLALALCTFAVSADARQRTGRIDGRITRPEGTAVSGVSVVLNETSATTFSDHDGRFAFPRLAPGTYSLSLTLGEHAMTVGDVRVTADRPTEVMPVVEWLVGFSETLIVSAPSRRPERIIDAPGAVTSMPAVEIEQRASHAQLPKLVEFAPGVQVTQSGLYDYNVNARGFNSTLNHRVATLIDGRDPSFPFLGAQEWAAASFPLDDLASVEFLRGPSAALYGANASSGVLNLTSKDPRSSLGGVARVTFGELATANLDFRWAYQLGNGWYGKVVAGFRRHDDFSVSRVRAVEYTVPCASAQARECLPLEAVPLARDHDRVFSGALRVDKHMANGMQLVMEGGVADVAGPVLQTAIGRIQFLDAQRPWARLDLSADRFNLLASYTGRRGPEHLSLASGGELADSSRRIQVEGQTNFRLAGDRVRIVAGGSVAVERVDTFDEDVGRQTALYEAMTADKQAVFAQADWNATPALKLVAASRADFSSLHDAQLSPKASLVYSAHANHTVRFTFNRAFQVPNYAELFLQADAAPPADLSALNALCLAFAADCRLGRARVLAVGNPDLAVETTRTWEVGYKGIFGGRAFFTLDFYRSVSSDFVTDLLPQFGTPLGRLNSRFGPWQAPPGVPETLAATIRALAPPILSNNFDGAPILVAASYANFGDVNTQGIDAALNYYFPAGWRASASYSWFDFDIQEQLPGFDTLLLPNAPAHSLSAGVVYEHRRFNASTDVRWVDDFAWSSGPFQGHVRAYSTVDLTSSVPLSNRVSLGVQVSNLFDDRHWESFGGDVLRRRALTSLKYRW